MTQLEITTKELQSIIISLQREHRLPTINPFVDSTVSGAEDVALVPTSCRDLQRLGRALNGFCRRSNYDRNSFLHLCKTS
ncbi:Uncharacterized protein APZ42_019933 [Daphnia magna]|uniref:Uncharacterized protein n=1 Tax=Daphnia magna TaxID=35525 RepID=A0A164XTV9_9CRUS|nr:Uncharacterized protein APZ42_019933 [Daphnia magna]